MSFSYSNSNNSTAYGNQASLQLSVNVTAGDLIVVTGGAWVADAEMTGISDDDGNDYDLFDNVQEPIAVGVNVRAGYVLSAIATSSPLTITVTFNTIGTGRRNCDVNVFTPDSGDTVTLEGTSETETDDYRETTVTVGGTFSMTGTDLVVIATAQMQTNPTETNHEIPSGTAADGVEDGDGHNSFYKFFTSNQTNLDAEYDISTAVQYAARIFGFKSAPAAPPTGVEIFRRRIEGY